MEASKEDVFTIDFLEEGTYCITSMLCICAAVCVISLCRTVVDAVFLLFTNTIINWQFHTHYLVRAHVTQSSAQKPD